MLIDWLTLRCKISNIQEQDLLALMPYMAKMQITNAATDEVLRSKLVIDIDQVRSDFSGMVWSISSNGADKYLNIGASPASLEHGSNLFGSSDYYYCKEILLNHARSVLKGVLLFNDGWLPRRLDVTQNYFMQSKHQVKDALHFLRSMDGVRQKATVQAGDSVYWGYSSHYRSGKAYDKGAQAIELNKKALKHKKPAIYTAQQIFDIQSILRLELKLGRQFFDEHTDENILTNDFLINEHEEFFGKFIGSAEVTDMDKLYENLIIAAPSKGRAMAAYDTFLRIKQNGYEFTKETMSPATFRRHRQYLKSAGLSESDMTSAKIIELRKRRIDLNPVYSWQHLDDLLRMAA
jgi:II/X family phage/plasmid replication protein